MQLNIQIKDSTLQDEINAYILDKNKQVNELILEALNFFLKNEKNKLNYQIQNPDEKATTIDFNLESESGYQLFKNIDNVEKYAKELRINAWK